MNFVVWVPEVWYQRVEVEADNATEAVELVKQGGGDWVDNGLDYSHTLDEGWDVEEQ